MYFCITVKCYTSLHFMVYQSKEEGMIRKHMKKLLVIISLVFVGMAVNAQLYMGGSFDLRFSETKTDNGDKQTTSSTIGLFPEIGYYLNDRFDIGLDIGISSSVFNDHISDNKTTTTSWLFSPFVRYSVIQAGNFEVIGKGSAIVDGSKSYTSFGVQVVPVLAYNLNDHIALQANLNFLSVGTSYNKVKDGNATTRFNLGFNANNLANIGNLTVGFIYKF